MGTLPPAGHPQLYEEAPIDTKITPILILGAAALATLAKGGAVSSPAPAPPGYVTRCASIETGSVDGFVSNQGWQPVRLRGEVRFLFTSKGAPSRPEQLAQADADLPPGQAVRVARVRLEPRLRDGEECRLDVERSLRKD
jgi:hypothetical protein